MTAPIPQSKAMELIASLNEMLLGGVNDDRLEEIIAEAERLKSVGMTVDAYNVLGMAASLRVNVAEVDRLFNAAFRSGGRSLMTLRNYAVSMATVGDLSRAIDLIDEAVDIALDDISTIMMAIALHEEAYDTEGLRNLIARIHQLGKDVELRMSSEQMDEIDAAFAAAGTNWRQVAERVRIASEAFFQLGKMPRREFYIHDGLLFFSFVLDAPVDEITEAESLIIDAIACTPYTPADSVIYFSCAAA